MSYIRHRPEPLLTAAESTARLDSARHRMLEAWLTWLTAAEQPPDEIEAEIVATCSALRQIAETVA